MPAVSEANEPANILFEILLRLGDNCLILAQQIGKWCGHAPELEEDIALANVGLDLIGQTQMWLGYAGEAEGKGRNADDLAFLRDSRDFRNVLLVEQGEDHYGVTVMRLFLFDAWHRLMLTGLCRSSDNKIAEIAAKALKEATYHFDRSSDLVIRLGDGSAESHAMMQDALNQLWFCTDELIKADAVDGAAISAGLIPDLSEIGAEYGRIVAEILNQATLIIPGNTAMRYGGKGGLHGEGLGYLLAEMQTLQRNFPGAKW